MRPAFTKIMAASLAALLVGATVTTSEAGPRMGGGGWHGGGGGWHGGGGGWHGGGWHGGGWGGGGWRGGGWHGGGWYGGGWAPGLVGGLAAGALIGGALAAPYAYNSGYGDCYQYRPIYSTANGAYLGNQMVNVCD
jgi:hypothetical protein